MKTIEEAAKEYAEKFTYPHNKIPNERGFKAGVEWAQEWISVENELPKLYEKVFVKTTEKYEDDEYYFDYSVATLHDNNRWDVFFGNHKPITHWRPIELK